MNEVFNFYSKFVEKVYLVFLFYERGNRCGVVNKLRKVMELVNGRVEF